MRAKEEDWAPCSSSPTRPCAHTHCQGAKRQQKQAALLRPDFGKGTLILPLHSVGHKKSQNQPRFRRKGSRFYLLLSVAVKLRNAPEGRQRTVAFLPSVTTSLSYTCCSSIM